MRKGKKAEDANAVLFKRLYEVKPETFEKMKTILQAAFDQLHKHGGKPPKLTVENKLYVTLKYLGSIVRWKASALTMVQARAPCASRYNG
jgi:hypothetical protein